MSWVGDFTHYPVPNAILAGLAFLFIAWVIANWRPGFPGRHIGIVIWYGIRDGFHTRFDCFTTDISYVLSPDTVKELARLSLEHLEGLEDMPETKRREVEMARAKLRNIMNGGELGGIKVYGARRDFIKHVWIVLADRDIESYALPSRLISIWFPFPFARRVAVYGIRHDMPFKVRVHGLGTLRPHIFIPVLDPRDPDLKAKIAALSEDEKIALAYMATSAKTALKLVSENKFLRRELSSANKRILDISRDRSKIAKQLDECRAALSAKTLYPRMEEEAKAGLRRPPEANTYVIVIGASIGAMIGYMFAPGALGPALGAIAGGLIASKL